MSQARATDLARIVATHEYAKCVLMLSHQVNLHALDAMVRSLRGGSGLRGFAEVSAQMRNWTRELHASVTTLTTLSAEQVQLFSAFVKQRRLATLLAAADGGEDCKHVLRPTLTQVALELEASALELARLRRRVRNTLEELVQLGLMARVLSTAAMIESTTAGDGDQRRELTLVSKGFAERSEQVAELIRNMLGTHQELSA